MAKVDILNYISDSNILRSTYDTDTNELDITDVPQNLNSIITLGQGGGGAEVEELNVTANGTYTAPEGHAYSPVNVNLPIDVFLDEYVKSSPTAISGDMELTITSIREYAMYQYDVGPDWTITGRNVTYMGQSAFRTCRYLTAAFFPNLSSANATGYQFNMPSTGTRKLHTVDWGKANLVGNLFNYCQNLKTLILRKTMIATLPNVALFTGTPFANGGTGGTIYIPESLYDHLGDGSSSDYQSATNWSTVHGYGTITWAKIEGSIYE